MRIPKSPLLQFALLIGACSHGSSYSPPACSPGAVQLSVLPAGGWSAAFACPGWTFAGSVGAPVTGITATSGQDSLGDFHQVSFEYVDQGAKQASIRAYDASSMVVFSQTMVEAAPNVSVFPKFQQWPATPHHLTYGEAPFAGYTFTALTADSPWVFFDDQANTFILSAASHFMNAATRVDSSGISAGIDPAQIGQLPAGFVQQTLLVAGPSINGAYQTWGHALTSLSGKLRVANDSRLELEKLGYWTDNGASYYYQYDPALGYQQTLLAVRDYFATLNIPLAYVQLDSWWYPKGPTQDWVDKQYGEYTYTPDPVLFPGGLLSFQQSLGLPLITHARWIDPSSPYRSTYRMSNNVSVDPAYWSSIATELREGGVMTYEQDWLNQMALPLTDNLIDQDAFLDTMAAAMDAQGIDLQYCMPLPRHFLQSTRYANAISTRVSGDRFSADRRAPFLYTSLLASAVGLWPWSDVFMSSEEENLMLSTLSAGVVGVGDTVGTTDASNLAQVIRADGVIVKPDTPLVPLDSSFIAEAQDAAAPMVAATSTDFGSMKASYVYAFARGSDTTASFSPAELGQTGSSYVWDWFAGTGQQVASMDLFQAAMGAGRGYYLVVPVGPSGIAFLGDAGKYVSLGKKRVASLSDDGTLHAVVAFTAGESSVILRGVSPTVPAVSSSNGSAMLLSWEPDSGVFLVELQAEGGTSVAVTVAR